MRQTPYFVAIALFLWFAGCDGEDVADTPDAAMEVDVPAQADADDEPSDFAEVDADASVEHDTDTETMSDVESDDADASAQSDAGTPNYDLASGDLEVGYARVEAPWRVGAKPGQVGTRARDGIEMEMASRLSGIFNTLNNESDPSIILADTTEWTRDLLEEETENTHAGEFSTWFEPGIGIEQPPDIKATVLRRGDLKLAVVRADIYLMHEYLHRHVANLVEEDTGLGRDQIFLAGTHNHSAPQPSFPAPGVWSLADGFDPRHFVYLSEKIAEAIRRADDDRRPARLRVQRTQYDEVQFNIIGPSTVELAEGDGEEPEEIRVGYPRDHFDSDLDLLYFDDAEPPHEPIALIFSLGMHPETLPSNHGLTSGEFPIHVEKHLRRRVGVPAMWLPGTLGDIEPDQAENNSEHQFWRESFGALHRMSAAITDGVEEAFEQLLEDDQINAETQPVLRNISRDIPGTEDFPIPTTAYLEGIRVPSPRLLHGSTLIRLQALRLGDALLIGIPAEVTTDLSENIKSRVDDEDGEVYQGYVYPDNPEWVAERVAQNFSTDQVDPDSGAPIPIVTSMVNGYIGYVVTRWEYENRDHYRMRMTPHGPESADHLASHVVELVDEMMGGEHRDFEMPPWLDDDLDGVDELMGFFEGLEERVVALQRDLPVTDAATVGEVIAGPTLVEADEIDDALATVDGVAISWRGATADMPPPAVSLERNVGADWEAVSGGPGLAMHVFFTEPEQWTARWHPAYDPVDVADSDELRFRVHGTFRGDAGGGDADPIWDPDGADETYEFTSPSFQLEALN